MCHSVVLSTYHKLASFATFAMLHPRAAVKTRHLWVAPRDPEKFTSLSAYHQKQAVTDYLSAIIHACPHLASLALVDVHTTKPLAISSSLRDFVCIGHWQNPLRIYSQLPKLRRIYVALREAPSSLISAEIVATLFQIPSLRLVEEYMPHSKKKHVAFYEGVQRMARSPHLVAYTLHIPGGIMEWMAPFSDVPGLCIRTLPLDPTVRRALPFEDWKRRANHLARHK